MNGLQINNGNTDVLTNKTSRINRSVISINQSIDDRSVVELTKRCDASVDPMPFWKIGRNVEHQNEIGRVSSCAEHPASDTGLVDWTLVDQSLRELVHFTRPKPDDRQTIE